MPILFDSSVYIGAFRGVGDAGLALERWRGKAPIWMSSVVLEELYVGADAPGVKLISKLERDFERARRLLVPSLSDWTQTGRILAKMGAKYGFERIKLGRLTNDALLALSSARCGVTVVTANGRDFEQLSEFCTLDWRLN